MILQVSSAIKLRPIELSDSAIIYQTVVQQKEYLSQWLPFVEQTKNEQDTISFIESIFQNQNFHNEPFFIIEFEDQFCGIINCKNFDNLHKKIEIGYWLSYDFQKKGIMKMALDVVSNYVFEKFDINRIVIKCATENYKSQNVAKGVGYNLEGVEREGEYLGDGIYRDLYVFSLLKSEYALKRPKKIEQPGINHIEFWVLNLKETMFFYKGLLELIGWKQINKCAFATSFMEIYFKEMPHINKTNSLGVRHICFQANEKNHVDKVYNYLRSINAAIIREPSYMEYSHEYYTVDFYDPDGFIIEVAHTPFMKFIS